MYSVIWNKKGLYFSCIMQVALQKKDRTCELSLQVRWLGSQVL